MKKRIYIFVLYFLSFTSLFFALIWYMLAAKYTSFFTVPGMNTYPNMLLNILYQHGDFFEWAMGAALYLVPDLFVLSILALFSKNPYTILISYGIIQIILFSIIILVTFKQATKTKRGVRLGILVLLSFFLILILKHPLNSIFTIRAYLSAIFAPGYHFGGALLVFFSLLLTIKLISSQKWYLKFSLAFLLFFSGLSEPLTYIYFTLPASATLFIFFLLKHIQLKDYLQFAAIILFAALTSFICYHSLPIASQKINVHISIQLTYVMDYLKVMLLFFKHNPLAAIAWFGFFIWAPISLWRSFRTKDNTNWILDFTILFFWLTIIISTPVIILAIGQMVAPYYNHLPAEYILRHPIEAFQKLRFLPTRYFVNYLLGPSCFGAPLLFYKHVKKIEILNQDRIYAGFLVLSTLITIAAMPYKLTTNSFLYFQPKFIVCFNKYAAEYNLTNGVSTYQLNLTLVNAYNLDKHVAYVDSMLHPFLWQTTLQMYNYKDYNFVLAKSLNTPLIKYIGKPDRILSCEGRRKTKSYILVYQHNQIDHLLKIKH